MKQQFRQLAKKYNFLVRIDGHTFGSTFATIHRRKDRLDRIIIELALLIETTPTGDRVAAARLEQFFDDARHFVELDQLDNSKQIVGTWRYPDAEASDYYPVEFDAVEDQVTPERIIFLGKGGRVP